MAEVLTGAASAAGPDLRELLMGSERTLGVLTEVAVRVRPRADVTRFEGFMLPSFQAGIDANERKADRMFLFSQRQPFECLIAVAKQTVDDGDLVG